ncbi:MAG: extracellular solute-binding protein [Candidatus Woesebacteria bacterium]|nr:MAG: extracellular solute-binding protein [Candidatus Woesebacteria bacterium]
MKQDNSNSPQTNIPPTQPAAPPPSPQTPFVAATPPVVTPPTGSRSSISKILPIIGGLIVLVILVFLAIKFVPSILKKSNLSGQTTITWWGLWENDSVVKSLIDEYQSQNPKIKIDYVHQSKEDYRERLTNALAQGKGPDIFRFHNSWVPMFKNTLDSVPPKVMTQADFSQSYYPVIISDLTTANGIMGLPIDFDNIALFINQDIFDTYGKSAPLTWDDLRQTAQALTVKDENGSIKQAGVALGRTENVDHWPEILALMMMQNGVKLNTLTPSDRLTNTLSFFTLFSKTDDVWDETLPPSTVAFANGKVAMYFGPSWRAHDILTINPNLKFKTYPVPQLPKEHPDDPSITYASYWVEGVSKTSPNKEAAWDFMKFITSKDSLQKLYTNETKQRMFGEIYPRVDMANLIANDPLAGAFVRQGHDAQSWFLQSLTWDGQTGINSEINKYFEDAIGSTLKGSSPDQAVSTLTNATLQVLSQYGLAKAPSPSPKSQ